MIDTKVKVNGKTVAEYDLIEEPNVKTINGEGPDDNGNVEVLSDWDYMENKPFYDNSTETVMMEESTVTFNHKGGGVYGAEIPKSAFELVVRFYIITN